MQYGLAPYCTLTFQARYRTMTTTFPPTGKVRLRTNLADYPVVRALKEGKVRSDLVEFDFCGPKIANQGFKPMISEGAYDAGELAIGSFLQAKVYGRPLVLLPAVVMARFQHHTIVYNASKGELAPKDLEGRRIAVRSYTQTTGIWVRGILKHEHGVDLCRLRWVCTDDAHVAEYRDPPIVERPGPGAKTLDQMLHRRRRGRRRSRQATSPRTTRTSATCSPIRTSRPRPGRRNTAPCR